MPRKPDPETKDQQAYIRGKTEEEKKKIKAVKEICARNNLEVRDVLMAGINKFLRDHHWPPGNSQTLLSVYDVKPGLPMCSAPGCEAMADYKLFRENIVVFRCRKHKHWKLPWIGTYGEEKLQKR